MNGITVRLPRIDDPRATLALVCLTIFIGAVDLTVVTAVLPKVMLDLGVSVDTDFNRAAWIITGYLLAYTVSMTFAGRLSDLYGRRIGYAVCLAIFIAGSVAVAGVGVFLPGTLETLIAGRVIQALGAGAMVPIGMALATDLFPPERRPAVLGIIAAVDTAGWMVGHLYGGVLMRAFDDWRLLFWVNIPLGLAALVLTWRGLRGIAANRTPGTFDWQGALLIAASLTALNLGLSAGGELGQADFYGRIQGPPPYALPLVGLALALLGLFVWVERRTTDPLIDIALFHDRMAAIACAVNTLIGFALAIALANVPLFVNTRLALLNPADPMILRQGAWDSGWLLSALTLTMAAFAAPGGRLTNRIGPSRTAAIGMALALIGYLLMSRWQADTGYVAMAASLVVGGIGLGLALAPAASMVIAAAGEHRHGVASALVIVLRLVGMTLGISTLTLWGVQRQDTLRRAGATDPLAASDPVQFLLQIATRVVDETFLFAAVACLLALLILWLLERTPEPSRSKN